MLITNKNLFGIKSDFTSKIISKGLTELLTTSSYLFFLGISKRENHTRVHKNCLSQGEVMCGGTLNNHLITKILFAKGMPAKEHVYSPKQHLTTMTWEGIYTLHNGVFLETSYQCH